MTENRNKLPIRKKNPSTWS